LRSAFLDLHPTRMPKRQHGCRRQLAGTGSNSNVLTLGDNACLLGASLGYTDCYEKIRGRFIDKTFVIPGNHDDEKNGSGNYFDYFGAKANPDVVLQVHGHQYERFGPMTSDGTLSATGGMCSFVVGTGGAQTYAHAVPLPSSKTRVVAFGVMRLSLSAGNAKWQSIDVDNALRDAGAFDCRKK
jgi:hypothetical protein